MEVKQKKNIFFTRCLVDKICGLIIDRKYWINMAITSMMEKLRFMILQHPKPYILYIIVLKIQSLKT